MPTEIKVVLPTPGVDDLLSVADAFSTTEDTVSILEESFTVDFDADVIDNDKNNDNDKNKEDIPNPVENQIEGIYRNVNVNLTSINKSLGLSEPKSTPKSNTTESSLNTEARDSKCVEGRTRSGKLEHLFHQSNRDSLVTCVRSVTLANQSHRESSVTCVRSNNVHQRPHSSNQYHWKRNEAASQTGSQQKQKKHNNDNDNNSTSRVENKSSQTGDSEVSEDMGLNDVQVAERPNLVCGKTDNDRIFQKRQIRPSSSPARLRQRPVSPKPRTLNNIKLSITGTYDIDTEHRDIMMKALNSYHQHRHKDNGAPRETGENGNVTINEIENVDDKTRQKSKAASGPETPSRHRLFRKSSLLRDILASFDESSNKERKDSSCSSVSSTPRSLSNVSNRVQLIYDDDKIVSRIWTDEKNRQEASKRNNKNKGSRGMGTSSQSNGRSSSSLSSFDSDKTFKLARCRLIYNEEPKKKPKSRPKSSYPWSQRPCCPIDDVTSGVLVDSVGHVYGRSIPRPLSALPSKFHVYLQERSRAHYDGGRGGWCTERRYYT